MWRAMGAISVKIIFISTNDVVKPVLFCSIYQVEDALLDRGSSVAVPYWDWTTSFSKLPKLLDEATYYNWRKQRFEPNPFFGGRVKGENAFTTRFYTI